jgi:exosortase
MSPASSYRVFAVLWTASLVIWWHPITATLALALRRDAYTHLLLILPISISLIVMQWSRRRWKPSPSFVAGLVLLAMAALIGVAGLRWGRVEIFNGDIDLSIEMLAVVTWWIGSFVSCFGTRIFQECLFPLFFLLWLIPMTEFALGHIVSFLQQGTASFTRLLLASVGVPVAQASTRLTLPGLTLEIAQECSSVRSSMMLVVSSMVLSYLLLRSLWGRTVVILASIPLAIAKNGLRVFALAMLSTYVNPGILDSSLHHQGGVLFLAASLAAVLLLIWLAAKVERRGTRRPIGKQIPHMSTSGNVN